MKSSLVFKKPLLNKIRTHIHTVGLIYIPWLTGPDPDTLPGYPGWSRLVESHCTIPRECTKGPHLKEK